MAKNTLLSEGQVRKFMKLAAIGPLAESFLTEQEEEATIEGDDAGAEEAPAEGDDAAAEDDAALDLDMDDEPTTEEEPEAPAGEMDELVNAALEAVAALARAAGVDAEIEHTNDAAKAPEMEMSDEASEMDTELEEGVGAGNEVDLFGSIDESVETRETVQAVARRVAERLVNENREDQLLESIAVRIAEKLI